MSPAESPFARAHWTIEPASWTVDGDALHATAAANTDFWRRTHYGFTRDSGHLLGAPVRQDFVATVRFTGEYRTLYDQAGLMLRASAEHWIKAGVEYVDGTAWLSVVVTHERSDWSLATSVATDAPVWLRLRREADTVHVEHSADGVSWTVLRVTWLEPGDDDLVGPMLACPEAASFAARFDNLTIDHPG